jgi:outer membrane protein assembly factor BamE (lipoprotein component of BamABCDE complex)
MRSAACPTAHHRARRLLTTLVLTIGLAACSTYTPSSYFLTPGLNDDRAAKIVSGMDAPNVEAIIGAPHQRVRFDNLKATAWDYRYIDSWGYIIDFSVMIGDDGKVVTKISARAYADNR